MRQHSICDSDKYLPAMIYELPLLLRRKLRKETIRRDCRLFSYRCYCEIKSYVVFRFSSIITLPTPRARFKLSDDGKKGGPKKNSHNSRVVERVYLRLLPLVCHFMDGKIKRATNLWHQSEEKSNNGNMYESAFDCVYVYLQTHIFQFKK